MRAPLRAGLLPLAIVGWGILRDWWWVGVLLAIVMEFPRLIKGRKDFQAADFSRAFTLSWLLLGVVALILWLQDSEREQFELVVEWLPLFFLPVILCQLFSVTSDYPLHVSTFFSNWRFKREMKDGVPQKVRRMNFGYPYLFLILVGASWNLDTLQEKAMYAVLVSLVLWRFLFFTTKRNGGRKRWGGQIMYVLALCLALSAGYGSIRLYQWLEAGKWINYISSDSPIQTATQIGKLGEIKKDTSIHWRIIKPETSPPALFKDRVFNRYINETWYHAPVSGFSRGLDFQDFNRVPMAESILHVSNPQLTADEAQSLRVSRFRIRGKGKQRTLLPNTNSLVYMHNDSVEALEFNSLGTVLATNPITGIIDYTLCSQQERLGDFTEMPPFEKEDLQVPANLEEALRGFISEYEIDADLTPVAINQLLKQIFIKDFTYSTLGKIGGTLPIKRFLSEVKSGHCEYFATAGCLLLRELGYPARYVTGYAVKEYEPEDEEWILRGIHAHAWVRYWDQDAGLWKNAEFTPPGEMIFSHASPNPFQSLQDSIKKSREDFIVWRSENGDSWVFTVLPWFLVLLLVVVFGRNLLKARSSGNESSQVDQLMQSLAKTLKVDPRRASETYAEWLKDVPLATHDKRKISTSIENLIYGESDSLEELKNMVKEQRKAVRSAR